MKPSPPDLVISAIHAAPSQGVIAVTGGGSAAISRLLATPGASRTVLEAVVPYAQNSLQQWVGGGVDSACSEVTARAMAMASFERARQLANGTVESLFGLGVTASLASDRLKRGDHRVHAAVQTADRTVAWSLKLAKGARSRAEEETVAAELALHAVAVAAGVAELDGVAAEPGDELSFREKTSPPLWRELILGSQNAALINPHIDRHQQSVSPRWHGALFPGAFAPPHNGHRQMAMHAAKLLGKPVTLEIALANVDKPPLDYLAIEDRLVAIAGAVDDAEVWLTRLPTFHEKARVLGCQIFIVGADTITRIAQPRYYGNDPRARDAAIAELASLGARFLVFGRAADDRFDTLGDLQLPEPLRALCDDVPEADFREDVSSTELRGESA